MSRRTRRAAQRCNSCLHEFPKKWGEPHGRNWSPDRICFIRLQEILNEAATQGVDCRWCRAVARVSRLSFERTTMAILPWLVPLLISLALITYIPEISLWLPRKVF